MPVDTDADGTADYLDEDTDDDGILDVVEGHDSDGNGQADSGSPANTGVSGGTTDADNDGLYDGWDNNTSSTDPTNSGLNPTSHPDTTSAAGGDRDWREVKDTDGDGIGDNIDIDDDNDGIPDIDEDRGNDPDGDEDGDGILNWLDTTDDGNGGDGSNTDYTDSNGDGMPDIYDFDRDGIPNHLDKDSDNDGIVDIIEAGGVDINQDGEVDYPTPGDPTSMVDVDNDGLDDARDDVDSGSGGGEVTSGTPWAESNTDGTGNEDYLDIDADDDGIIDNIEAQLSTGTPLQADGTDTDRDGIGDAFDPDNGGTYIVPVNTDGTGNSDYIDTDTDDDGESDLIEGWDTDGDGTPETTPSGSDSDGDGLDDNFDNVVGPNDTTNPSNNGQDAFDFPDADAGTGELDWREVVCSGGTVILAVNDSTTLAENYCINDPWTYYYNPDNPSQLLFAIEQQPVGGNTNEFTVTAALTVSSDPQAAAGIYSNESTAPVEATFVMGRYWNVGINTGSLNGAVNIRFYYDTDEADTMVAVAERWNDNNAGSTSFVSGSRWFMVNADNFDHNSADLQAGGIQNSTELFPDSTGAEDGVSFAQFNGLTALTGGGLAYTIGSNSVVLPIELLHFSADALSMDDVLLTWITATELNSDRFDVERSVDLQQWKKVAEVEAAGISHETLNYLAHDLDPEPGVSYYRLKLIDRDGSFEYSNIETIALNQASSAAGSPVVYPNPSNGAFSIGLPNNGDGNWALQIHDVSGKVVWKQAVQDQPRLEVQNGMLAAGVYTLRVSTATAQFMQTIVITD